MARTQNAEIYYCLIICILIVMQFQARSASAQNSNKADRLEWFQDLAFGLFIHWSIDSQVGSVISHSMVGASEDYLKSFIEDLPATFYPGKFDADEWARLAKIAGFKYVVFTTKHHSGFCMFPTRTNDFHIGNTPYKKDITAEIVRAFKAQDIAPGFYYSPDDFYVLQQQGTEISRRRQEALPVNNPGLMASNKAQIRELLTNYGAIDILFYDGQADGLRELTWQLQPECVITRGAMVTPEIAPSTGQSLPSLSNVEPWEACFTMGTSWQFKPTNETYQTGAQLIRALVETRAKGGNMLLNIGPTPEGAIPDEQKNNLREIGLWMMVNKEAIYNVRPWPVTNEGDIWFTKSRVSNTVYAFICDTPWIWGKERTFNLKSVRGGEKTSVSVLGQNDKVLEYNTDVIPVTKWQQTGKGLQITATRAQRLYNDRTWPNPVVLKITHAEPVLTTN